MAIQYCFPCRQRRRLTQRTIEQAPPIAPHTFANSRCIRQSYKPCRQALCITLRHYHPAISLPNLPRNLAIWRAHEYHWPPRRQHTIKFTWNNQTLEFWAQGNQVNIAHGQTQTKLFSRLVRPELHIGQPRRATSLPSGPR